MSESKDRAVAGYEISLFALLGFAGLGALFTIIYACCAPSHRLAIASLGLLSAGAAAVVGGLIGFLFGVPHTKESGETASVSQTKSSDSESSERIPAGTAYKANTSLEQISDWLTKIIVGVGLVEIKQLPGVLQRAASYLSRGFEASTGVEALFVTILTYFAVCGFIFGFLWARIYLRKWFAEADSEQVAKLGDKVNELEARYVNDAKALHVVSQQLQRSSNDTKVPDDEITTLVKDASTGVKMQLFDLARRVSEATDVQDYNLKNETAASVFRALISDDAKGQFHRNHAELSYVLSRRKPQDLPEALVAISAAIDVRDRCNVRGWKYYEARRARYRIHLDTNYKAGRPSDPDTTSLIIADLGIAVKEQGSWNRWLRENPDIDKWITLNQVQL